MELEYIVHGATENGEITPLECQAVLLLPDVYAEVDGLILSNMRMPEHFLRNTARGAMAQVSEEQRLWLSINSLVDISPCLRSVQERAESIVQMKIQSDLGHGRSGWLFEGSLENAQSFGRTKLISSGTDVTEENTRALLDRHFGSYLSRLAEDAELAEMAIEWYRADGGRSFERLQTEHLTSPRKRPRPTNHAKHEVRCDRKSVQARHARKTARAAIKKIYKLFSSFNQDNMVRMFIGGEQVELSHPQSPFKFVARASGSPGWLETRTTIAWMSSPYDLSLQTKDGTHLANLCVYLEGTPVLDQLFALSMFIGAGDEIHLLEKANFYDFRGKQLEAKEVVLEHYPTLESKFPLSKASNGFLSELLTIDLGASFREEQALWLPYKDNVSRWVTGWFDQVTSRLLPCTSVFQISRAVS